MAWNIGVACVRLRVSRRDILRQLHIIGIQSVMIVLIAAALIGVVTSQQGGYQMQSQIPLYVMGSAVIRAPTLPTITMAVRTGPISRTTLSTTTDPMT